MLHNYFATVLRNLARNKLYAFISVFGLAIGMWAALLAALVIHNQLSYEHFISGYENVYESLSTVTPPGQATMWRAGTTSFFGPQLKLKFKEIEAVTRLMLQTAALQHGEVEYKNETIYWADANVFNVLPLPPIAGDLHTALQRPDSIVLTRSVAQKYFGRDVPLGETLIMNGMHPMTVRAVIEDLPANGTRLETGIFASGLASWSRLSMFDRNPKLVPSTEFGTAFFNPVRTYLRVAPHASPKTLQNAMPEMMRTMFAPIPSGWKAATEIVRMDRLNVHPGINPGMHSKLMMTMILGLVILIIAGVNFVNLLTARSARRASEVAIRKVVGARRHALILQFLGEAMIYVVAATLVAVALTEMSLPYVNAYLNTGAGFDYLSKPPLLGWIALATIGLGLLAGAYPAFVLSSFRPLVLMQRWTVRSSRVGLIRQSLVTLQFAILIGLIITTTVVYLQRLYATHDALRIDTDQMLLVRAPCNAAFTTELRRLSGVRGVACSNSALLGGISVTTVKSKDGIEQLMNLQSVEHGLLQLYGVNPVAGRLPGESVGDTSTSQEASEYVINETAVRRLGFTSPQAALGSFKVQAGRNVYGSQIVGVIPDFSLGSIEQKIEPKIYIADAQQFNLISIKLTGQEIPQTLTEIDRLWSKTDNRPIERFFLDQHIQGLYLSMLREAQTFGVFSVVAILIACLGLLGLSASLAERRTKEIGIRKAMGASTASVMYLLAVQFVKPVLYANLLAWPIAGLAMNRWLQGFAYHIDLSPWLFIGATGVALAIALLTVSLHCYLVARAKPVLALRYE